MYCMLHCRLNDRPNSYMNTCTCKIYEIFSLVSAVWIEIVIINLSYKSLHERLEL